MTILPDHAVHWSVCVAKISTVCTFHFPCFPIPSLMFSIMQESITTMFKSHTFSFFSTLTFSPSLLPSPLPPSFVSLSLFQRMQSMFGLDMPLSSLLIKPIQRITKYPLLLKVFHSTLMTGDIITSIELERVWNNIICACANLH